jgi:CheY-like chemotaxis protein
MREKILIVDDDPDFVSAITIVLERAGFHCVDTPNARLGLEKVDIVKPDLIILDVMMEDISAGFRFANTLRARERHMSAKQVPIIMITNVQKLTDLAFEERVGTQLLPVDVFLDKPVEPEILVKKVEKLLN